MMCRLSNISNTAEHAFVTLRPFIRAVFFISNVTRIALSAIFHIGLLVAVYCHLLLAFLPHLFLIFCLEQPRWLVFYLRKDGGSLASQFICPASYMSPSAILEGTWLVCGHAALYTWTVGHLRLVPHVWGCLASFLRNPFISPPLVSTLHSVLTGQEKADLKAMLCFAVDTRNAMF